MIKVKICGITNLDDALAAIEAGADMLGFNFYPSSPRFIEPERAREIIRRIKPAREASSITHVGVFVNETNESVAHIVELSRIDAVQLHGDEPPQMCNDLRKSLNGRKVIKALRVTDRFDIEEATRYDVDAIMLDAFHDTLRGGTGKTFNWALARATRDRVPRLILSGGLSPENIADAIARVQPYGVDACSSLESRPGRKDASRMKAFVRAAHSS